MSTTSDLCKSLIFVGPPHATVSAWSLSLFFACWPPFPLHLDMSLWYNSRCHVVQKVTGSEMYNMYLTLNDNNFFAITEQCIYYTSSINIKMDGCSTNSRTDAIVLWCPSKYILMQYYIITGLTKVQDWQMPNSTFCVQTWVDSKEGYERKGNHEPHNALAMCVVDGLAFPSPV